MALKRTRITKKVVKAERRIVNRERKTLSCKECGLEIDNVSADIAAITCATCCIKMSAPPDLPAKPKPPEERRPRGWQFMKEYRAPDGTLYHRGEKVHEETPIQSTNSDKRPRVRKTASKNSTKNNNGGRDIKKRRTTRIVPNKRSSE